MAVKSKRIRIPIEDGITTFGTGYEIGPRLIDSSRFIHKYVPMKSGTAVDFAGQSWEPSEVDFGTANVLANATSVGCAERFENSEIDGVNNGYLFGGYDGNSFLASAWDHTGTRRLSIGSASPIKSIVHWKGLSTSTTFLTGPTMRSTTDRVNFSIYAPTGFPGVADVLLVYQNRLWLASDNKVYYTDVLNPNNVRQFGQINPIIVPMNVTYLDRVGVSDVDPGAQSHLIIAGLSQIWVLDGSPAEGNAVLRRLTNQFGIAKEQHAAQTNLGLAFLGTDRQLYLINPGAVGNPTPIGLSIRNLLASGEISLAWRRPYLMVFVGDLSKVLFLDFSQNEPKWWGIGPNQSLFIPGPVSSRFPNHDYFWVVGDDSEAESFVVVKVQDPSHVGSPVKFQTLKTGYIFEQGHEVVLRKMHTTVKLGPAEKTYNVTSSDSDGLIYSKDFTVPAGSKIENFQIPIMGRAGCRGDFIFCSIGCEQKESATDLGLSALQHWEIEYDIIPRQKI